METTKPFVIKNESKLMSIDQVCEQLNIGKNTAYELLNSGQIKAFKIGRSWKIPKDAVDKFIARCTA